MGELAFLLVLLLWYLSWRESKELASRIEALEQENDQIVAKINEMIK